MCCHRASTASVTTACWPAQLAPATSPIAVIRAKVKWQRLFEAKAELSGWSCNGRHWFAARLQSLRKTRCADDAPPFRHLDASRHSPGDSRGEAGWRGICGSPTRRYNHCAIENSACSAARTAACRPRNHLVIRCLDHARRTCTARQADTVSPRGMCAAATGHESVFGRHLARRNLRQSTGPLSTAHPSSTRRKRRSARFNGCGSDTGKRRLGPGFHSQPGASAKTSWSACSSSMAMNRQARSSVSMSLPVATAVKTHQRKPGTSLM